MSYRAWPFSSAGPVFSPRATGFTIAGDGVPNDGAKNLNTEAFEYIDALVTVTYEQAVGGGGGGGGNSSFDFFTETVEPTIEYFRAPHEQLFWSSNDGSIRGLSPDQTPAYPFYRERYTRTYFGITLPIPTEFTTLQNHINTNPVVSPILGITYAPRTILYGNRRINYNLRTDGSQSANLSLDFTYRQETWRRFWNWGEDGAPGRYAEIEDVNGPINFPPEADLSPVLLS